MPNRKVSPADSILIRDMRMKCFRHAEICNGTGFSETTIGRHITWWRSQGVVFPSYDKSRQYAAPKVKKSRKGMKPKVHPKVRAVGTWRGRRVTCHAAYLWDAVREMQMLDGWAQNEG